jgi:RNA 3'-terminal phosphate cyclase (ATP)
MTNIRAKREKPGLQPQHLKSLQACGQLCAAKIEGASLGSKEITYQPGREIEGGYYEWDIGTAGSTTMLVMTILPLACFARKETRVRISGGLFQDFAPSAHYMQHVLLPTLGKMGIHAELNIIRPGYYPRGGGIIEARIRPVAKQIEPLQLLRQGNIKRIEGASLSSRLKRRKVSERMAEECLKALRAKGYEAQIESVWDETSIQEGASLALWAETDSGCLLGSDMAGRRGRSSEEIGRYVAESLIEDIETGATVDRYLADQVILFAALAHGTSEYLVPRMTDHVDTNLWLVEQFGAGTEIDDNHVRIQGIGHRKAGQ